jgi:hypothetical protein
MNVETSHIRCAALSAVILLGVFVILRPASASPESADKIAASKNKIVSALKDLKELATSVSIREGKDSGTALEILHTATEPICELDHLRELLLIDSLIQNDNAKNKVDDLIRKHVNALADSVDRSVGFINAVIAGLHNEAVILAVTKLRDDLRESKNVSP